MKQLTAVFAIMLTIMLGFSAYMYDSRTKIQKNYQESLKNQSRYLANESGNLLEKEQRITALQLALEALPKDEKDERPVTAEAVKALTDATLAYVGDSGNNIDATWNYQMPNMISHFQVSPDGKHIAILDNGNVTGVWNTQTHERILDMKGSMSYGSMDLLSSDHVALQCVDVSGLTEKWAQDFVCNGVTLESGFVRLGDPSIAYFNGNVISVYDPVTGKEKYRNNVNDSVLDVSDKDGDGKPTYITQGGGLATPAPDVDEDAVFCKKYFADELRQVVISNGVYVRQHHGSEVIYYGTNVYDEEWNPIAEDTLVNDSIKESCLADNVLAVLTDEENGPMLTLFGKDQNRDAVQYELTGDRAYKYKILGEYKDRIYLGYDDGKNYQLFTAGSSKKEIQGQELFGMQSRVEDACLLQSGKLIYSYKNDESQEVLMINDLDTGEKTETELPKDIGYRSHMPVYYEKENAVYLCGENEYICNMDNKEVNRVDTPDGWIGACCFSENSSDGIYAVSDGKIILLQNKYGKTEGSISCRGVMPLGMTFAEDMLMVLYSDGGLCYFTN